MAKDILKEAIADAKAVREVALANAKAALEEAFTPRLQSMLSAKLSETLNEEEEEVEEGYATPTGNEPQGQRTRPGMGGGPKKFYAPEEGIEEDIEEITGMENEGENLDEEIDLEEILNELELEEGEDSKEETVDEGEEAEGDETVDEAKDKDEETMDEAEDKEEVEEAVGYPNHRADQVQKVKADATDVNQGLNEGGEFDLDALLEEINNLDENEEDTVDEIAPAIAGAIGGALTDEGEDMDETFGNVNPVTGGTFGGPTKSQFGVDARKLAKTASSYEDWQAKMKDLWTNWEGDDKPPAAGAAQMIKSPHWKKFVQNAMTETELEEVKAALEVKTAELNEVNLLNSKLLYVNRIFKANNLDEAQKLRVVETLDNASNIKEAKLIYETIKDTFTVAKSTKTTPKKSIKEGLGMASKAAGTSTAPKKEAIIESTDMVARMQKLANIKINQ